MLNNSLNHSDYSDNSHIPNYNNTKDLIKYNELVLKNLNFLSENKIDKAIEEIYKALKLFENNNSDKSLFNKLTLYCNLGILYYYNDDLDASEENFNKATKIHDNLDKKYDSTLTLNILSIKLWTNKLLVEMAINSKYDYKFYTKKIENIINRFDAEKKSLIILNCIYILFRIDNLSNEKEYEYNFNKAMNYTLIALKNEIKENYQTSIKYYKLAITEWEKENNYLFLLIIIHNILNNKNIYENSIKVSEFEELKNRILNMEQYSKIDINKFFIHFDKKIIIAKEITKMIIVYEKDNDIEISNLKKNLNIDLIKLAVKINFKKIINKLSNENNKKNEDSIKILNQTLNNIKKEDNEIIFLNLAKDNYIEKIISNLKSTLKNLFYILNSKLYTIILDYLKKHKKKKILSVSDKKLDISEIKKVEKELNLTKRVQVSMAIVSEGGTLIKLHFNSKGNTKRFIKFIYDGQNSEIIIKKNSLLKNTSKIKLKEIRGLIYGNASPTFHKNKNNKKIAAHTCFSIFLENGKFIDFFAGDNKIDSFYIGLYYNLKLLKKDIYGLSIGNYYWKKLFYILKGVFVSRMTDLDENSLTFTYLLYLYSKYKKD